MKMITAVRGFKDILTDESGAWRRIEAESRELFAAFGFEEIRIPLLEKTELFRRGIGESTDIVEKEMYTFLDRNDEHLTLRPEATASIIRAYLEHNLHAVDPITKLFTMGPMFRRERPQKGRLRQFHQIDVEVLGIDDPRMDAELLFMLNHLFIRLGIDDLRLHINSLGCPQCRPRFREAILSFLEHKEAGLCDDCRRRLKKNPLRVFDCKVAACQAIVADGPELLNFICDACGDHFETLKQYLSILSISFEINRKMVRGLDYYTKTTFEITAPAAGAQNAVVGGGRYDGLVKELGGPDIPGIGFAIGCERLIASIPRKDEASDTGRLQLFVAAIGREAELFAYTLVNRLRVSGIPAEMDFTGKGLKGQMKRADKLKSHYVLIIGEREISEKKAALRNMQTGAQTILDIENLETSVLNAMKQR